MQGAERFDIPMPDPPPGGKRRCKRCGKYKDCNRETFGTTIHYLKGGKGKRYWRSRCRDCERATRSDRKNTSTWTEGEKRARTRALTRLVKMVPHLFLPLFIEELRKEYMKEGLNGQIETRIKARTAYLNNYIKAVNG